MYYMMIKFGNTLLLFFTVFFAAAAFAATNTPVPDDLKQAKNMLLWDFPAALVYNDDTFANKRIVAFSLDSDDMAKIELLAYATSMKFGKWDGCRPFRLNTVTIKKDLTETADIKENLLDSAVSYADALCPKADTIIFTVSPFIKLDDADNDFFFKTEIKKDRKGKWLTYPAKKGKLKSEESLLKGGGRSEWRKKAEEEYKEYKDKSLPHKLAFTHNVDYLTNPFIMIQGAKAVEKPLPNTSVVHIKQIEGTSAWVDEPMPLFIPDTKKKISSAGWWLISGNISPLDDKDKIKTGIPLTQKAGRLNIFKVSECEDKTCKNAADIVSFIKEKYGLYDWKPNE